MLLFLLLLLLLLFPRPQDQPSYVRRRCLPHLSWTVCKQGLLEIDCGVHEGICAYLGRGATWFNLKCLATHSREDGGLGLFSEGSAEYQRVFGTMPGTTLEDRPESVMRFLVFLRGRERTLAALAAKDVQARDLGDGAQAAAAALADPQGCAQRSLMGELLHRGLHLARYGNITKRLASDQPLGDLLASAADRLLSLEPGQEVMGRLGVTAEELAAQRPRTWVEAAVRKEFPAEAECQAKLPAFLDFHRRVGARMRSHLQLRGENVLRTPWLAGALLAKDPLKARAAANELLRHLCSTPPGMRTRFETAVLEDDGLVSPCKAA